MFQSIFMNVNMNTSNNYNINISQAFATIKKNGKVARN